MQQHDRHGHRVRSARSVGGPLRIDHRQPPWRDRLRTFVRERDRFDYSNFIDRLADLYGRRTAFVLDRPIDYPGFAGDILSYEDVRRLVDRFGHALRRLGVERGDRVGLITANRIELAFCSFAAAKIGAIPVPMSFMLRPPEIEHIARRSGCDVVVTDRFVFANCVIDPGAVPSVKRWAVVGRDSPPGSAVSMRDLMRDVPDGLDAVPPRSKRDLAMLFFTSGTTGAPKGAMLSHESVMVFVHHHARAYALLPRIPRQLALLVMPVAHSGGYAALTSQLAMAQPTYFMSRFDPVAILDAIERFRPTLFAGIPAMYRMLEEAGAAERDLTSIKVWAGGADAFSDDIITTFREAAARPGPLGIRRKPMFIRGYGMSETNSYIAQTPPFECGDNCLGWVLPPVRFRIRDERGRDVRRGDPGELWVRGPTVSMGYWRDPEATAASVEDGWFRTGDIVRQGKWRMLFLVSRSNDIIKVGGYKVSALEVDHVLNAHPDIQCAATVGVPDPVKGERPFSAVVPSPGARIDEGEVLTWASRRLAAYKCPRGIVVMPDMPLTFSMKPKRADVRDRVLAALGNGNGSPR